MRERQTERGMRQRETTRERDERFNTSNQGRVRGVRERLRGGERQRERAGNGRETTRDNNQEREKDVT